MSRVLTIMLIVTIIMLLFQFGGLVPDENPSSYVLKTLGLRNQQNLKSTNFYLKIFGLNALLVAGISIAVAVVTQSLESALFVGAGMSLISVIIYTLWDFVTVFNSITGINEMFAVLLVSPILLIALFSVYDWARGRD